MKIRTAFFLALALVLAGCGTHRSTRPLPTTFDPLALSALDDSRFFAFGTLPCSAGRCFAIERTTDGGRTFDRVRTPVGLPAEGTTPTLRFADGRNGFLWVPFAWGSFWSTHDGGATWRRMRSPAVVAFTTAGSEAYAIVARCTPASCRDYRFARGPASAVRWRESHFPYVPNGPLLDLAARGRDVWILGTPDSTVAALRHDVLSRSTDGGRTFATGFGPCVPGLGGRLVPSSTRVVWAVCPTGMLAGAARSTDGGATFAPLHTPPLSNGAVLFSASDDTTILAPNAAGSASYRTTDGGRTWRRLRAQPGGIVFTSPRNGIAVAHGRLVHTADAGLTWQAQW